MPMYRKGNNQNRTTPLDIGHECIMDEHVAQSPMDSPERSWKDVFDHGLRQIPGMSTKNTH